MRLYRGFETQEELDRAYDPGAGDPPGRRFVATWRERSRAMREASGTRLRLRYGPTVEEHLNLYPAGEGAPVHLFFHGGYWRANTADDFDFVAAPLVRAGVTTAIVNYALCPAVGIDEIVRQARAAVAWAFAGIARFGGDPGRISVSGHSAGGHLVGMLAVTDWARAYDLPADVIKAGIALSPLMDLAPFPYSYLQPKLQLSWDQVRRCSPVNHVPLAGSPRLSPELLLAVGGLESGEFHRQAESFDRLWRGSGHAGRLMIAPDLDHFSILEAMLDGTSALGMATRSLLGVRQEVR
ncbi:MAG: alpha/beta hydrolase [Geminicoccaceae bacterium]|nr:alpha/beta hydrolase [Geminicoccaceae bacterium]